MVTVEASNILKIAVVAFVWIVGTIITYFGIRSDKYKNLELSIYQPKSWVFGVVWSFIYLSYLYVWWKMPDTNMVKVLFISNMVLNLLWTVLFFYGFMFKLSFAVIILLAILTFIQVIYVYYLRIPESGLYLFLLLIYFSWLCVASILNYNLM